MSGPGDTNDEDDVDEFLIRLGALEESIEALHAGMDIVLAFIDDRKTQQPSQPPTQPNESINN